MGLKPHIRLQCILLNIKYWGWLLFFEIPILVILLRKTLFDSYDFIV